MFASRVLRCIQKVETASELTTSRMVLGNLTKPGRNTLKLPDEHPQPLHYDILGVKVGSPLRVVKLKYLLACRKFHPESGGDPEMFLRASLAYQDVLKDYGLESVRGEIVNLGNFQADSHTARQYLEERMKITEYLPVSTLDDHIAQLEDAQSKISYDLEKRITANDTDAMWLLEDIDSVMEATKSETVTLRLSDNGEVTAHDATCQIEGGSPGKLLGDANFSSETPPSESGSGTDNDDGTSSESRAEPSAGDGPSGSSLAVETVTLSKADLLALNAKHMVQQRTDIAGMASRTATTVMNNTTEAKSIAEASTNLLLVLAGLGLLLYAAIESWERSKMATKKNPHVSTQLSSDTMLPWWGNDIEYEKQVKRIFVDEWRRARSSARKTQIFQEGISRESLPADERENLDVSIFTVTADKLRELKANADAQVGKS